MNAPATVTQLPTPSFAAHRSHSETLGRPKSFILFGDTGTRKTTMVAELVKAGIFSKALVVDIDNGAEALMVDNEIRAMIDDGRIILMELDPTADKHAFFKIDSMVCEVAGRKHPVIGKTSSGADIIDYTTFDVVPDAPDFGIDLVSIDTYNVFQQLVADFFLATTFNESGRQDSRKAWGLIANYTDTLARVFQNNKRFVGSLVMHEKASTDDTGVITPKPKLSGSAKDSIATIPSLVVNLAFETHPETGLPTLAGTVGESKSTKNRYRLDPKIYDFDLVKLYSIIDEKIGRKPVAKEATAA